MSDTEQGSRGESGTVTASHSPEQVPYAVLVPAGYEDGGSYPLCLVLHGGGGSHHNLIELKPLFDRLWAQDLPPPMVFASASTGLYALSSNPPGSTRPSSIQPPTAVSAYCRKSIRVAK